MKYRNLEANWKSGHLVLADISPAVDGEKTKRRRAILDRPGLRKILWDLGFRGMGRYLLAQPRYLCLVGEAAYH